MGFRSMFAVRLRHPRHARPMPGMWDGARKSWEQMRRWIFNFLAAISLVFCIAMSALWVRSDRTWDALVIQSCIQKDHVLLRRGITLSSDNHRISLEIAERVYTKRFRAVKRFVGRHQVEWKSGTTFLDDFFPRPGLLTHREFVVYAEWTGYRKLPWAGRGVAVPQWIIILTFLMPPMTWLLWTLRNRRNNKSIRLMICSFCRYDLRASPDRCPECGTVPKVQ